MSTKEFNFEDSVKELEKIASALEKQDISLDESIALFEKGITISKQCSDYLDNAKQKIILLTEAEGEK